LTRTETEQISAAVPLPVADANLTDVTFSADPTGILLLSTRYCLFFETRIGKNQYLDPDLFWHRVRLRASGL